MLRRALVRGGVPALVFAIVAMAMAWRLWWPEAAERRAFNYDALWQYWGDLQLQIDAYRAGEVPLWNPWDRGGYPVHADPQVSLLYPVNWALVGAGLAVGPEWWLVPVKALLHLWILGLGTFAFLRRRGTPLGPSYAGGAAVMLVYPVSKTLWTALNWGWAWAPWMLLAVDAWAERPTRRRAAGLALAFAMCFLTWAPAASWYALLVVGPYGVWAVWHHGRAGGRAWWREALSSGALAAGLLLAMVAAQVLSTQGLVPETVRASRDLAFVTSTAFTSEDLFGFLVPRLPATELCYMGFATLLLAAAAVTLRPEPRRLVLAGAALAGVLLAFGGVAPVLPSLASAPGPFDLFRRAHRYLYVTTLPLAILAAEGLAELARVDAAERRRRIAAFVALAGALLAVVFLVAWARATKDLRTPYLLAALGAGLGGAFVAGVAFVRGKAAPWVLAAASVFVIADTFYGSMPMRELSYDPLPKTPHDAATLGRVPPLEARVYDRGYTKYRPGTRLHVRDLGGYQDDPLALRRYARARDLASNAPRLLALMNVRFLLEDARNATRKSALDNRALKPVTQGVYELPAAVPAVMWVDRATVVADEAAAWKAFPGLAPGAVVVEERTVAPADVSRVADGDPTAAPVAGKLERLTWNTLRASVDAPADGVVVIHETFHPGWRAWVDGKETRVVAANGLFRAVVVPAGAHSIVMRYEAPGFTWLAIVSLIGMAASVVMALRREPTPSVTAASR